jgi:GNAT superfamily N-acetyltransferase
VEPLLFADLALSRRLEAAEGYACAQFALVRRRLFPESASEAVRIAGADVVYDGIDSPTTQTFGLGMHQEATPDALAEIERFFSERGSSTQHEISPFAGISTLRLLCDRGYRPIEISNVLYRATQSADPPRVGGPPSGVEVRLIGPAEATLWTEVSTRGWTHEHPELRDFLDQTGALLTAREGMACFLALVDGIPAAAGALSIYQGIALLAGASTVPEHRSRGLQAALLQARIAYAREHDCDLAMMVCEAGSNSQRNSERQLFRIAYTRIKWQKTL